MRTIFAAILAAAAMGCVSTYAGSARVVDPSTLNEREWLAARGVPEHRQKFRHDCGAAALRMVLGYYGVKTALEAPERGLRADALRDEARARGFDAYCIQGDLGDLVVELGDGRPVVVGMVKPNLDGALPHFEVVVGIDPHGQRVATIDPARGFTTNTYEGFQAEWAGADRLAIVMNPPQGNRPEKPSSK